jgi:hypothetical protein
MIHPINIPARNPRIAANKAKIIINTYSNDSVELGLITLGNAITEIRKASVIKAIDPPQISPYIKFLMFGFPIS